MCITVMVVSCAAINCANTFVKGGGVTFHRFPLSNPEKLKSWVAALQRKDFKPTKYHYLCSKHFTDDCFLKGYVNRKKLKDDAIPTIFDFPPEICKIIEKQTTLLSCRSVSEDNSRNDDDVSQFYIRNNSVGLSEHQYCQNMNLYKRRKQFKERNEFNNQTKRTKREGKTFSTLSALLLELKEKSLLSYKAYSILTENFLDSTTEILNCLQYEKNLDCYSEVKRFLQSLYYYSPNSYEYLRNSYCLPQLSTIRSWFASTSGKPGFSKEILDSIAAKSKNIDHNIYAILMFDEIQIKKKVEWDGNQFVGHVDMGENIETGNCDEAKEVIIFIIVGINVDWKIPIAYFFTDRLTIEEKCNLINLCLILMHDIEVNIVGITCDCLKVNFNLAESLGAKLSISSMLPWFPHPTTKQDVCIFFDSWHLLKLLRNFFAESKILIDYEGREIKWELIEKLQILLSQKVNKNSTNFYYKNCELAVQALSSSVADLLLSLEEDVLHEEFREVVATTDFIYLIEGLIDICNSKNILSQHLKSPLQMSNKHIWQPFLSKVIAYLLDLRNSKRKLIRDTNKKSPIVGFVSFIVSLERIFDNLIATKEMKYLLTYKFNLDHLHVCLRRIYKCVSSYGNLSALEFKKAFASHIQGELKHLSNHSTALNRDIERTVTSINDESMYISDPVIFSEYRKLDIDRPNSKVNRPYLLNIQSSCEYVDRICIEALVKDVCNLIACTDCCSSVLGKNCILNNYSLKKTCKLCPSLDVLKICKQTDKVIKELLGSERSILPKSLRVIETQVLNRLSIEELFNDLSVHVIDNTFPQNHVYILIKTIIRQYIKISCVCKEETTSESLLICQ